LVAVLWLKGEEKMAIRDSEIPHYRERASLQSIEHGNWVSQTALYPAGKQSIANMLRKGWIETEIASSGAHQFRITRAGKAALVTKIPIGR
jgi:hypothetical protein